MFVGNYTHNIDSKGRVFVPIRLREELGQKFYICRGMDCRCIRIYTTTEWHAVLTKLKASPVTNNIARRKLVPNSAEVEMDAQGRIMLTEKLREYAGLGDKAFFAGMIDWVEIWDPDRYDEAVGDDMDDPNEIDYEALLKADVH